MEKSLPKINERITESPDDLVRVIDSEGEQIGLLSSNQAIMQARKEGLDLVLISDKSSPPVCRIIDYGKYKFHQEKKAKDIRKKQHNATTKEIKMRYKIEEHYNKVKLNQTSRFINSGDKVKITINFRGREIQHTNLAFELLNKFKEDLKDTVDVQQPPTKEGRNLTMVLMPKKK
uniref:translation initiation factor 3 n=1 Tax=Timspurckia oligopyrenoides TaxID=708627 RepID=UPI001FCD3AF3|nr:translation initiation factor 3 [Timspurckia oligopyrenoides]UNJ17530.1 translation initiation factor 3 [Timspurckia oligopyrenoides]